jgi:hypothetical protein
MKKRIVIYGTLIAIVVAILAYWHFRTGVTYANYRRINTHMTRAEITELLGGPTEKNPSTAPYPNDGAREWWGGKIGDILLIYDKSDRIIWKEWHKSSRHSIGAWITGTYAME